MIFRTVLNQYQLLAKTASFLALGMSKQNSGTVSTVLIAVCYCSAVKWVCTVIISLTEQRINVSYPCYYPQHSSLNILATSMYRLYFFWDKVLLCIIVWPQSHDLPFQPPKGWDYQEPLPLHHSFKVRVIKTYPKPLLALTSDFLILREASLPFPC